ncbi:NAD(P)/FAD-dependent oxidoreductase [Sungkyunkwania multivorans]|uniref:NAD(P)/FAD-dependent oxidoreductase n=1 Tax=Sungkyunkwania multivorans TaxID=1173618 RepID=A0ABW3CYH2_9FLAO
MEKKAEIVILGGGLAGLTLAVDLALKGHHPVVIEKDTYPRHRVCGEYVSNEVLPFLNYLGIDPLAAGAKQIDKFRFSASSGKMLNVDLPLGGFGISRYLFDELLYKRALKLGVTFIFDKVEEVIFQSDSFVVKMKQGELQTAIAVGAYGKRSNLDKQLDRRFIQKKSPWLAVKAHYSGDFQEDLVALHNFEGGYCGLSKVETDAVNVCYLANYGTFKAFEDIEAFQREHLSRNPELKAFFNDATMIWERPLTISQVCFERKPAVENHLLMIGDTAGLINPLCGNGMAMAIHSAKICAAIVSEHLEQKISRAVMERQYQLSWNKEFSSRIKAGNLLAKLFRSERIASPIQTGLTWFPKALQGIIKRTHGNPILT